MQLHMRRRIAVNADTAQCDRSLDGALGRKPQHAGRERTGPVRKVKHESSRRRECRKTACENKPRQQARPITLSYRLLQTPRAITPKQKGPQQVRALSVWVKKRQLD